MDNKSISLWFWLFSMSMLPAFVASVSHYTNTTILDITNPVDFDNMNYGHFTFDIQGQHLDVVFDSEGIVMYNSNLEMLRQIQGISKTFDYASIALANSNTVHSLGKLITQEQLNILDDFTLADDMEYHVSSKPMVFQRCLHYCSSKSSDMINDPLSFYRMSKLFKFDRIWIDSNTTSVDKNGVNAYKVFLDQSMIFPENTLIVQ